MTRIHDLLTLPEHVRKGDFVQSLASGILAPDETVASYAVTGAIEQTFEHALTIVDSALKTGASQAAYLHGSFGSGKSHFMAILDLMLANHPAPWSRGELHALKAKFDFIGAKRLLQIPMHFLGAESIEGQIFDTYVRWLGEQHPDADLPGLFADAELFENARGLRQDMGDERFFAKLNQGRPAAAGWGKLASAAAWDPAGFDAAVASRDATARERLFSDLVKTHFPAFTTQIGRFIDLDRGLQVLARHAKGLGYDGVVLYLDELILWLAGRSSDLSFIQREVQKLVKLKEAQHDQREVPIVSFIARQRDLAQLVGEQARGDERAALEDSLAHHQGRFEEVVLADSNLPAIVAHRVVRPRDDDARATLREGFERAWKGAGAARATLIGSVGSEQAFAQVFPFSPALVEALVALSDCLQRERTAIRILMELIVDHLPELTLGPIIPVGDAFDVIAGGEDPFDQVMRGRFNRARDLYEQAFLPLIRSEHGTEDSDACQRQRDNHKKRLGCSGCAHQACRDDMRLAKTLLMAALVPGAPVFQGMTVKRLVHLNHGTIASPIPGAEVQLAAEKLRRWGAHVGPLRVGDQSDPELTLGLEGLDLAPIIDKAREVDTPGTRKQQLRRLLFEALSLPDAGATVEHTLTFRGVRRKGQVRFANVRELSDAQLRCPAGMAWQLVLDYPFDQGDHSPVDDLLRIEAYRDQLGGHEEATLVWLPTFFSAKLMQTLGDYIAIDYILDNRVREYLGDRRPEDQIQARGDLTSLRDQKKSLLVGALKSAYGLAHQRSDDPALDLSRAVERHVVSLAPDLKIPGLLAGSMQEGMQQVIGRLLEHRFPHHPQFGAPLTTGKLQRVRTLIERLIEQPDRQMNVDASDRKDLQHIADPLGLTHTTESRTILEERALNDLEQRRQQAGLDTPTVRDLRGYTDPDGHRGLTTDVQDLLVWSYLLWSGRSLVWGGREEPPGKLGGLLEDAELVRPELPTEQEWQAALTRGAELMGITFPNRHLSARNLSAFCARLDEAAARTRDAQGLATELATRLEEWADQDTAHRLTTARSAASLIHLIEQSEGAERARRLAAYTPETSATAVARSLSSAQVVLAALRNESRWLNFHSVQAQLTHDGLKPRAEKILADLSEALRTDELNRPLASALAELTQRAAALIKPRPHDWKAVHTQRAEVKDAGDYEAALRSLAQAFAARAGSLGAGVDQKLEINVALLSREREEG
jgi:hypothetical protein